VPLVVLELVQAASMLTPSTTAALVATLVPVNREWTRLTPSSSFLFDHASSAGESPDASARMITLAGYTWRNRLVGGEWHDIDVFLAPR
jgi:hypothetical protein